MSDEPLITEVTRSPSIMAVCSVVSSRSNAALIAEAARLWIKPADAVLDVTYGKGNFWTAYRPENLTTHDIALDGVDFRQLPEADSSFDVVVFDPPYMPGARAGKVGYESRYGLTYQTDRELREVIDAGLKECARVVRPQGRLFVKCSDYVNARLFITGHHAVVSQALACGLRQVDEFVHHSGTGPNPPPRNGAKRKQVTSRRAHSFLCIFQKGGRR